MATAADMFCAPHLVAKILKSLSNDSPRTTLVMTLEVSDILQNHVPRAPPLDDRDYFMKQRAPRLVLQSLLLT